MKTRFFLATAIVAFGITSVFGQTMKIKLSSGSEMEFKTSEVTSIEFKEADKPVTPDTPTDDGKYHNGYEYIDLGLPSGLKWATCNVGASKPEEYGDYYAWGETETKDSYTLDTYKFYTETTETIPAHKDVDGLDVPEKTETFRGYTKYVYWDFNGYKGFYDHKMTLEPEDDVAHVNWGGDWRMPNIDDINELRDNCSCTLVSLNNVNGYKVTGPNGRWIFFPIANFIKGSYVEYDNHCMYWTSDRFENAGNTDNAYFLNLLDGYIEYRLDFYYCYCFPYRSSGLPVRPVCQ